MSSKLQTVPAGFEMGTTETLPLGFDATKLLAVGQSVSAPFSVLKNIDSGKPVTLADSPTVSGNVITQIVRGSALVALTKYALSVTFTAAANTTWTMVLVIYVPQ
jgi:hypothetical protein